MNTRQFVKDYRLPLQATVLFIILLILMLFVRFYEQSILAGVLNGTNNKGQDYATLLSVDKSAELNKNEVNDRGAPVNTEANKSASNKSPAPLTVSSSGPGDTTTTQQGSGLTPSTGGSTAPGLAPGDSPAPLEPFMVSVEGVGLESAYKVCEPSFTTISKCSKIYTFKGMIKGINGPGNVGYGWRFTLPIFDEDGTFQAGTGETLTTLGKIIKLDCAQPVQFAVKLVTKSPNADQSSPVGVTHNCD